MTGWQKEMGFVKKALEEVEEYSKVIHNHYVRINRKLTTTYANLTDRGGKQATLGHDGRRARRAQPQVMTNILYMALLTRH